MIALVFAVAQGYVYPFYHHLTAPVYAHHVPVYHHAPVYNHAPVFTKWPEIVEVEEEDTMEEDAELETTLAPEFEETEEIVTTEAPEEEEVVTERVPVEICKNEGGQLVPCAHGVAPGSSIYAYASAPGVGKGTKDQTKIVNHIEELINNVVANEQNHVKVEDLYKPFWFYVCKNEGGQLVPCAHGVAPGSAIYAMADAPGYVPTVAAAPVAEQDLDYY